MDRTAILDRTSMDVGLSTAEAAKYSVGRAILAAAGKEKDRLEYEVSAALSAKLGRPNRSGNAIFVPAELRPQAAGLDTTTNAGGKYTVATLVPSLIDALRQQMRCVQLGATFLPGLSSNLMFATELTTTAASWTQENSGSNVGDTDMSFGARGVTPHTLQSTTSLSRQLLAQNSVDLERKIRLDLMKSHAIAFDAAAINGSGSSNQPLGLLQAPNLPTVSIGASGGPATYASIVALEQTIADANADSPDLGFLTTPDQRAKLRQVYKGASGVLPVWGDEGPGPLGYRGAVSKAVPQNLAKGGGSNLSAIICGNFSYMLLAQFGAIEIVVDPFAGKKVGMVQITSFSMVYVQITQIAGYADIVDAT